MLAAQGVEMSPKKIYIKNEKEPRNVWVSYDNHSPTNKESQAAIPEDISPDTEASTRSVRFSEN